MGKLFLLLASVVLAVLAVYATTNGNVALAVVAIAVLCVQGLAWLLVSFSQRRHHFSSAARRDVMTGLPNRAAGREAIEATLSQQSNGQHYAVTLIKLSNMRELAAMYGTEVVEVILLEAGRRLQTLSGLTTLASLGGSQFLLLVERNKNHDIDAIAQQVMHSFDAPFSVNAVDMTAECHIGFALSPEHGVTYSDLMRRASLALSNCANEAKPYAIYVDGQDEIYFRQLQVAGRLQHAIANNGFEIRLQPQLVLPAQRIVAAELLLSWVDTEMGRMSPEEFIPLAERSGDITAITRWVLRQAVELQRHWRTLKKEVRLSVNVSPRDILHDDFVDEVIALVKSEGLADWLTLEITESALLAQRDRAVEQLQRLVASGVHIAMDDYGTGYSSLLQLKRLPIHELKIDKTFIAELHNNSEDETIVRSTIEMAHGLGLKVVAEGVESATTLQMLSAMRCDIVQGHFVGDPVSLDEFDRLLA